MDSEQLIFIKQIGEDINNNYVYDLFFTDDIDLVWGESWQTKPAGICGDIPPTQDSFNLTKRIVTEIKLDLAQDNTCFSMQDCMSNIIPLGWENIDDYDEYPDDRLVLHYGETYEDIEEILNNKNINLIDNE